MARGGVHDGLRPQVAMAPGGARNVMRESGVRRWPVERASVARALVDEGVTSGSLATQTTR